MKEQTIVNKTHTCECGNAISAPGWNNNYNRILRCEICEARRAELVAAIRQAIAGKSVDMVYVSTEVCSLLNTGDFDVEISRRRADKMAGQLFQVVEA